MLNNKIKEKTRQRVRALREERNVNILDLAYNIGIGVETIKKWESGKSDLNSRWICKLADFYDVTVDYIYGLTEEGNPWKKYDWRKVSWINFFMLFKIYKTFVEYKELFKQLAEIIDESEQDIIETFMKVLSEFKSE